MKYVALECEYIGRNYGNKFYAKCQNLAILLKRAYDAALDNYDVIVMPTLPYKVPKLPDKTWSIIGMIKIFYGLGVFIVLRLSNNNHFSYY